MGDGVRWALLVLALPLPSSTSTYAAFENGNQLLEACSSTDQSAKQYCIGYTAGVVDSYPLMSDLVGRICIPPTATLGQVRDIVIEYLEASPGERHLEAAAIVLRALITTFPC